MPRPIVQQLPPAPQRGEDFQTFTEKANAHVAALTPWTDDVNDLAEWVNDTAEVVEQNAQNANDAASAASDSADAAANSAQSASDDADRAESAVAVLPEGTINDLVVAPDMTWSSQKIAARLNAPADRGVSLKLDFASDEYFVDDGDRTYAPAEYVLTVERATPKWVFGPNGKLREVPPNTIARQWNPETGEPEGVLIEESRTNLLLWSEDFTQDGWVSLNVTRTSSGFVVNGPTGRVYRDIPVHSGTLTISARFSPEDTGKLIRFAIWDDHLDGVSDGRSPVFEIPPDGFLSHTWHSLENARIVGFYNGGMPDGTSFTLRENCGVQLEAASTPSSYIPTQDSPVTRAADNVSRVLGGELNPQQFTLYFEFADDRGDDGESIYDIIRMVNDSPEIFRGLTLGTNETISSPRKWSAAFRDGVKSEFLTYSAGFASEQGLHKCALFVDYTEDKWGVCLDGSYLEGSIGDSAGPGYFNTIFSGDMARILGGADRGSNFLGTLPVARIVPRALSESELVELTK